MGKDAGSDETIRVRPKPGGKARVWWLAGLGMTLGAAAAGGWIALRPAPAPPAPVAMAAAFAPAITPPPQAPSTAPSPPQAAPPLPMPLQAAPPAPQAALAPLPPLATEAEILGRAPAVTEIYRFAPQPQIVVLQFASLGEQAATLNRVAAMLERAGFPRDRILEPAELDRRIRASGASPETLYFGHDYRAADLVRFFADAARDGVALTPQERWLHDAMRGWGWSMGVNGALISLVREDPVAGIDAASRATILRHELSHGQYFTNAEYAAYARRFWDGTLTDPERRRFRAFLGSEGYDTTQDDLMVNETQAYLMHTQDNRFFNATAVGMAGARLDGLRALFLTGMPASWLRDCTALPARAPRRRQRRGAVRIGRMKADTRAPPRAAWSSAARKTLT